MKHIFAGVATLVFAILCFSISAWSYQIETVGQYFDVLYKKLTRLRIAVEVDDRAVCNTRDKLAAYRLSSKTLVLCKKAFGGSSNDSILKLETITHELVHLTQDCRDGMKTPSASALFDRSSHSMMVDRLSRDELALIENSYHSSDWALEVEAFYLEDKPIRVLQLLDQVCFYR